LDDVKAWTGRSVEEPIRMTEYRDKWRKYVYGVANCRIEDGGRTEQNTEYRLSIIAKVCSQHMTESN